MKETTDSLLHDEFLFLNCFKTPVSIAGFTFCGSSAALFYDQIT